MNLSSPNSDRSASQSPMSSPSDSNSSDSQTTKIVKTGIFPVFVSTFFTILLAEMGDKTQVATLLMTAESQSPWIVFLGASTALISTSILGVVIGRWMARRLTPETLNTAAGVILLFVSIFLLGDMMSL
ncbi:MAG: TMEM165/GDT1 family protein [Cyanobacteriota bacterium]|nr:TMEM165/GDT1 family protein [Cyanobacteriota bacterium]